MIADGLWLDRKQRLKRVHQPRSRRDCVGELVQIAGCEHWWFEDRGPQCTLLLFVDDATGRLMHLQFVESESTFSYFHATRAYLESWGKPIAFYSDKHGVFRVNHEGAIGGDGMTQFGRALDALNIEIICANSSQAKGRVERAHKTLQDRLVKELRLAGASSLVLQPGFIAGSPFPMAFPGSLLVPTTPARPCACNLGIRRPGPNQMPEQASHFRHGEGPEIGFESERVFFPRPQHDGSRRDRHAPASPA